MVGVMHKKFKGFYDVTSEIEKEIFESDKTIFILDTNCFLNLYRCEEETKNDFISVVNNLKSRLWFPFQVCLEYQRNRLGVISSSLNDLDKIKKELKLTTEKINYYCSGSGSIKRKYHNLHADLCQLRDTIDSQLDNFINENIESRKIKSDFITKSDDIRKWIDSISKNKVADSFAQNKIDDINKDGDRRYKSKIGPGWMDEKEKKDDEIYFNGIFYKSKYGDLYLWNELLEKAKDQNIDNIIFITNDVKEDWWYKVHGKTIGALECLKTEIINSGLKQFKMYTQPSFLIKAKDVLNEIQISDSSIEDFERLNKLDVLENNNEMEEYLNSDYFNSDYKSNGYARNKSHKNYNARQGTYSYDECTHGIESYGDVSDIKNEYKYYIDLKAVIDTLKELYERYDFYSFLIDEYSSTGNQDEVTNLKKGLDDVRLEIKHFENIRYSLERNAREID